MAVEQSFGVMNLGVGTSDRDKYALVQSGSTKTINIPVTAPEYGYMTPEELTSFICTDTLNSLSSTKKQQILNSISLSGH
jgi:hypothetical protein